ncbi:EF-hand domain [Dillenia turbinata]|uniref:EF-hand domain n=1 Tax=Dillenia turbinata TaxID=194707 RepID=A0AAN8Z9E3_9MAGN
MGLRSLFKKKRSSRSSCPTSADSSTTPLPSAASISNTHGSSSQIDELEQVFKKFDLNGDGKISASELGSIMSSLGQPSSSDELIKMINEVDADGDGFIDLDEFIELNTAGVDSVEVLKDLRDAFSVFDIDGNGSISAEELQSVMKSLGEDCTVAECRKMIGGVDCDGDGMINFEEFKVMMMMGSRFESLGSQRVTLKIEG